MAEPTGSTPAGMAVGGWAETPHAGIYASLFLASMGLLTLEVALTRFFSFTVWYHLAYLTISVAILGFGSSGALVAAFPGVFRRNGQSLITGGLVAAALATVLGLIYLSRFPLEMDYLTHALRAGEFPTAFSRRLLLYYCTVATPFLLAGFAVGVPFAAYPRLMGRLYFADLVGAALGCLVVVMLIRPLGVPGVILVAAALMLSAAAALCAGGGRRRMALVVGIASVAMMLFARPLGNSLDIAITGNKSLAVSAWLGSIPSVNEADYSQWTALNRVDAFGWDRPTQYQFWSSNGLMKGFEGPTPFVAVLYYDGSNGSNIYSFDGSFDDYEFLEHHLLRTPYLLVDQPEALVIGVGGGVDMMNAIKQGARHVTGVELQPETVALLKEPLREFTGDFYHRDDVTLVAGEGRHYIRKSEESFDVIEITAVDTFAAQATGAYVLAESYLYTVEAQVDFLSHLNENGVLSMVVGGAISPPPLTIRLGLNGYRALQQLGAANPEQHLMIVSAPSQRSHARTEAVLVKRVPFTREEVDTVETFADAKGFTVLYSPLPEPGIEYPLTPVLGADEPARQRFLEKSPFRVDAVYDANPFFYNIAKWRNLSPTVIAGSNPGSFVGQLVLVMMLGQSVLLGMVLIVFPLLLGAREGLQTRGVISYMIYFLSLGVGFMFIEISLVQ